MRLNKPNQLISIIPKEDINLTQRKSFNVFLRKAQQEIKFSDKYQEIDKDTRYRFQIRCSRLKEQAGLGNDDYEYIREELKKLTQILVEITDRENKEDWTAFSLLERIERIGNIYEFSLDWIIVKALKDNYYFTQFDLLQIAKLKSKYSVILYELAKRYYSKDNPNINIPKMSIDEFRDLTNTQDKYKRISNFKKKVLDVACEEISEKTNLNISYKTIKTGRRITDIKFKTNIEEKELLDPVKEKEEYSDKVLELFELLPDDEQIPSNKDTLNQLLQSYEYKYIKADIQYAKEFEPKNFMGFLKSSAEQGHFGKALLEKQKKEEEKVKQRKKAEEERKQLIEEIEQQAKEEAQEKYQKLSDKAREEYLSGYDELPDFLDTTEEEYIIGSIEDELKEKMKRKEGII